MAPDGQERDETIAAKMAMEGLEDMAAYLITRHQHCTRDGRMWSMLHCDQELRSQKYYILGTDCSLFKNISIW